MSHTIFEAYSYSNAVPGREAPVQPYPNHKLCISLCHCWICHGDYSATLWKQAAFGTANLNRITANLQQFGFKCLSAGMFHVAVDKPLVCEVIHVTDHTLGFTRPSPTILVYWKPPNNAVRPVWKETCLERDLQLVETAVNDTC